MKDLQKKLQIQVEKWRQTQNRQLREKYHYAREHGLTSTEAKVIKFWSKKDIDQLLKQRQTKET